MPGSLAPYPVTSSDLRTSQVQVSYSPASPALGLLGNPVCTEQNSRSWRQQQWLGTIPTGIL